MATAAVKIIKGSLGRKPGAATAGWVEPWTLPGDGSGLNPARSADKGHKHLGAPRPHPHSLRESVAGGFAPYPIRGSILS
jgi:hypothetical protein